MTLTAAPADSRKRRPGCPRITWLNTVQRDLRAYNLILNKAVDLAQNLCGEADVYAWRYALLEVHVRKKRKRLTC